MKILNIKSAALGAALMAVTASAHASIIISEVNPTGSSTTTYAADWFELTNTGAYAVDISGWKMDDNSNAFASAVALRGVTSIALASL
jgi:P pilus assembly chaperone PapD